MTSRTPFPRKAFLYPKSFISCLPRIPYKSGGPPKQLPTIQGLVHPGFLYPLALSSEHQHPRSPNKGRRDPVMLGSEYSHRLAPEMAGVTSAHSPWARTSRMAPPRCKEDGGEGAWGDRNIQRGLDSCWSFKNKGNVKTCSDKLVIESITNSFSLKECPKRI